MDSNFKGLVLPLDEMRDIISDSVARIMGVATFTFEDEEELQDFSQRQLALTNQLMDALGFEASLPFEDFVEGSLEISQQYREMARKIKANL